MPCYPCKFFRLRLQSDNYNIKFHQKLLISLRFLYGTSFQRLVPYQLIEIQYQNFNLPSIIPIFIYFHDPRASPFSLLVFDTLFHSKRVYLTNWILIYYTILLLFINTYKKEQHFPLKSQLTAFHIKTMYNKYF